MSKEKEILTVVDRLEEKAVAMALAREVAELAKGRAGSRHQEQANANLDAAMADLLMEVAHAVTDLMKARETATPFPQDLPVVRRTTMDAVACRLLGGKSSGSCAGADEGERNSEQ